MINESVYDMDMIWDNMIYIYIALCNNGPEWSTYKQFRYLLVLVLYLLSML